METSKRDIFDDSARDRVEYWIALCTWKERWQIMIALIVVIPSQQVRRAGSFYTLSESACEGLKWENLEMTRRSLIPALPEVWPATPRLLKEWKGFIKLLHIVITCKKAYFIIPGCLYEPVKWNVDGVQNLKLVNHIEQRANRNGEINKTKLCMPHLNFTVV